MSLPTTVAKPRPGPEDFRQLRTEGYYYVDKTAFIVEWVAEKDQVVLVPRPRRFGKTLNLSTLRYFLEKSSEDRRSLFEDLAVSRASEEVLQHQGRYPVILLTLKNIKEESFHLAMLSLISTLRALYAEHRALLESDKLDAADKATFSAILSGTAGPNDVKMALLLLSGWLHAHHGERVVILVDEYDAPIELAYVQGYYDEIIHFMRGFLGAALKTNPHLYRGMLTGIRRVSKESLFSDLNNVRVRTTLEPVYSSSFGFTEPEVLGVLAAAGRGEAMEEVRAWYNGYIFGGQVIYNPWSVLCFAEQGQFRDYWVATSADALLRQILVRDEGLDGEFEALLRGGVVSKRVDEQVALRDVEDEPGRVWSVLLTAGYLKATNLRFIDGAAWADLSIPNRELFRVWRDSFSGWLSLALRNVAPLRALHQAVLGGRAAEVQRILRPMVSDALSYQHTGPRMNPERVYQAFVLGLLVSLEPDYHVRSERESGLGRADVLILPTRPGQPGVVMEFKRVWRDEGETPEQALNEAHAQIAARAYRRELEAARAAPIHALAVAFDGKEVWVR